MGRSRRIEPSRRYSRSPKIVSIAIPRPVSRSSAIQCSPATIRFETGAPIWISCPVDALKALGNVDIHQVEFWIRHRNMFLIKKISGASHIYGKKLVDAVNFTTWRRWKDGPGVLKYSLDRAFCEGLNRTPIMASPTRCRKPGFMCVPTAPEWTSTPK